MRVHAIVSITAGALLALSCSSVAPVKVQDGDQCFRCRRPIVERATAAEMMDGNRFASKFRAPGCMAKYLADHPDETGTLFVTDFATGKWVRPENALFVPVIVNPSTGESDYHAFVDKAAATAAAAEAHTTPIDWAAVRKNARS